MEISKDKLYKQIKKVIDPEIGVSIMDLGLIYDAKEKNGLVTVKMTLTSPHCPMFSTMENDIKTNVMTLKGVKKVKINLVFKPMWSPDLMSPKLKKKLGF